MPQNSLEKLLKTHKLPANSLAEVLAHSLEEREALHRLNRSYRALSEALRIRNQAQTEQQLCEQIAQLLKDCCQYRYVWIGHKQYDQQKSVEPVAWSTETEEFLHQMQVSWNDGELGQGAVGRSLRSEKPVVFSDIPDNPIFAPWREAAQEFNFHSVASFPLHIDENDWAVLVIYTTKEEPFRPEELKLLQEIGGELSTGIRLLRQQADRKATQAELDRLYTAIEQSPVSIIITDHQGTIEYVNPYFTQLTGYRAEEAIGRNPDFLKSGKTPKTTIQSLWKSILSGKSWAGEFINRGKDGHEFSEYAQIAPIFDEQGEICHFIAVKEDISERKRLEAHLAHLAHHDQLTGLPNRRLFYDRLRQALALAERQLAVCALLFIDLNGFKQINDRFGHEIGDKLLCACAQRLRASVRDSDTVARIGGDEFVIICNLLQQPEASAVLAEKVLAALEEPFLLPEQSCTIGASIGISCYPSDGTEDGELLRKADSAMYQIKQTGRSAYRFFTE